MFEWIFYVCFVSVFKLNIDEGIVFIYDFFVLVRSGDERVY